MDYSKHRGLGAGPGIRRLSCRGNSVKASTIRRKLCLCVTMHRVINVRKNLHVNFGQMFNYTGCGWDKTQRPHTTFKQ